MLAGIFQEDKSASWESLVKAGYITVKDKQLVKVSGYLKGKLVVSDDIKIICREAFADCAYLDDIILPDSCIGIGDLAFKNCKSLTRFKLPANVERIGRVIFFKCSALETIIVDPTNKYYETGTTLNGIVTADTGALVVGCAKTKVGDNVHSICAGAFSGCKQLTDIYIPESVAIIDECAFAQCVNLEDVMIAGDFVVIGKKAFAGCSALQSVMLKKHVEIAEDAFDASTRIVRVDDSVRKEDFGAAVTDLLAF